MRLANLYEDRGLVFANEAGGILNPSNLRQRSFTKFLKRGGLPETTRFHDLRHAPCSCYHGGQLPKLVQELGGHASNSIIHDTYSHILSDTGGGLTDSMDDAIDGE
ncbi:MAG: tyrosine-type recombinase/integrase [Rubrobacteraceae bacterium]